jgi:predicted RNase H-like HicB family nuclease
MVPLQATRQSLDLGIVPLILLESVQERPMTVTAVYVKVPEGYVGFVEELPGANTQGDTLEQARENLQEAVELVLEANRSLAHESLAGQEVIRERMSVPTA